MFMILVWEIPVYQPPSEIKEASDKVLNEENPNMVHGYMNNSGYEDVREKIAYPLIKDMIQILPGRISL